MKKLAVVAMAVAALALTGCSKKEAATTKITKDNIKIGFVYIGTINDQGYTQAQDKGRLALADIGIDLEKQTMYKENVPENADCEKAIRDLIDAGCNVIYTTSFGFMDWTLKVAEEYPNIKFGHCSGYKTAPNMTAYFGKIYEARYLAGIVAGLKTKANKIGYVAAFPIPECIRGINGFTQGVKSVNPDATVEVVWTNTWFDPTVEKQGALDLLNRGCDIIEQHQDTTAPQVAAQEKGAFCIGYNSSTPNAAPNAYLTAPLFKWGTFIKDDVQKIIDGTWESRFFWEGLDKDMVELDTLTSLVAPGTAEAVEAAKKGIIDGSVKIFAGPVYDQTGVEKVPAGSVMTDDEVYNMSWFVQGVIGSTN